MRPANQHVLCALLIWMESCPWSLSVHDRPAIRFSRLPHAKNCVTVPIFGRSRVTSHGLSPSAVLPSLLQAKMTLDTLTNGHCPSPIPPKRPASSNCVVQKYGGTSVGKFAREIVANVIKPSLLKGKVAVVCSAVSATVKVEGTTNR